MRFLGWFIRGEKKGKKKTEDASNRSKVTEEWLDGRKNVTCARWKWKWPVSRIASPWDAIRQEFWLRCRAYAGIAAGPKSIAATGEVSSRTSRRRVVLKRRMQFYGRVRHEIRPRESLRNTSRTYRDLDFFFLKQPCVMADHVLSRGNRWCSFCFNNI